LHESIFLRWLFVFFFSILTEINRKFASEMDSQKQIIYLDNNATTPIDKRVLEAMMPFFTDNFANANSTHLFGVAANEAVKTARVQVSDLISAEAYEIVLKGLLKITVGKENT
jgi:selenocysteine lyase/cysteine desulfurase